MLLSRPSIDKAASARRHPTPWTGNVYSHHRRCWINRVSGIFELPVVVDKARKSHEWLNSVFLSVIPIYPLASSSSATSSYPPLAIPLLSILILGILLLLQPNPTSYLISASASIPHESYSLHHQPLRHDVLRPPSLLRRNRSRSRRASSSSSSPSHALLSGPPPPPRSPSNPQPPRRLHPDLLHRRHEARLLPYLSRPIITINLIIIPPLPNNPPLNTSLPHLPPSRPRSPRIYHHLPILINPIPRNRSRSSTLHEEPETI